MTQFRPLLQLACLALFNNEVRSTFVADPDQACELFGNDYCKSSGFGGVHTTRFQNWKTVAKVGRAPDGKQKYIIPYLLDSDQGDGGFANRVASTVLRAVKLFEPTNVHFERIYASEINGPYIRMVDNWEPGSHGCSAWIGPITWSRGPDQLPTKAEIGRDWCQSSPSAIAHEFMHTIGFLHEQSRPDRDQYFDTDYNKINNLSENKKINYEAVKASNVEYFGTSYDPDSIMQYPEDREMMPLKPQYRHWARRLGAATKLSPSDIQEVNSLYPIEGNDNTDSGIDTDEDDSEDEETDDWQPTVAPTIPKVRTGNYATIVDQEYPDIAWDIEYGVAEGNSVILYPMHGLDNQQFYFKRAFPGMDYFFIKTKIGDYCVTLGCTQAYNVYGKKIIVSTCQKQQNQLFWLSKLSNGSYRMISGLQRDAYVSKMYHGGYNYDDRMMTMQLKWADWMQSFVINCSGDCGL